MAGAKRKSAPRGNEGSPAVRWVLQCREESKESKKNRMEQNRENWDVYHMRHDFRHKIPGQSKETLPMQAMAVETTSAFFQQALVDMGDTWWRAEAANRMNEPKLAISPTSIQAITQNQLQKAEFFRHVGTGVKAGLLESVIITKVGGCWEDKPVYVAEGRGARKKKKPSIEYGEDSAWKLELRLLSAENFFPDPVGNLYEIEDMYMDRHEMIALSQGDDAIYDPKICEQVERHYEEDTEEKTNQQRVSNQNQTSHSFRGRVKITEFWGTYLNSDGDVIKKNCVITLANDRWLIRKPTDNPKWNQKSPYVMTPLLDLRDTKFPKALADAGSKLNIAMNELFNLMLDGAMRAVNGVTQIRTEWLEDPSQVEGGIKPGTNLSVNGQCPPGAKVLEVVMTGNVPADSLQIQNLLSQEFNRAMLTSDIRQGMQPRSAVPATQIVEASQTITSVFQGLSKNVEQNWIQVILQRSVEECMENSDDMDPEEIRALLPQDEADKFLNMSAAERFVAVVQGVKMRVFGITLRLQKQQDFQKKTTLIQTLAADPLLQEEFVKKYDMGLFLGSIMQDLGIDTKSIEIPAAQQEMMKEQAQSESAPPPTPGGGGPDQMSQVTSPNTGSVEDQMGSAAGPQIPRGAMAQGGGAPQ